MAGPSLARGKQPINKWATFVASCFIQACAGLAYSFSIYAPTMKDIMDLTQTEIGTVGSAVNLGGYFAVIAGSIYDRMEKEHQLGPRLVIWLGCLCCFCGYLGLWLLASGTVQGSFWQLLLFASCAGNTGVWFDTSALVTNVRNFPNDRGFVVGILKSFLGLSASIYTSIYMATFEPDIVRYLLMLALLPSLLSLVLSLFVNVVPYVETHENAPRTAWLSTEGRFLMAYFLVACIAAYQMSSAWYVGHHDVDIATRQLLAGFLGVLLVLVLGLAYKSGGLSSQYSHEQPAAEQTHHPRPSTARPAPASADSGLTGSEAQPLLARQPGGAAGAATAAKGPRGDGAGGSSLGARAAARVPPPPGEGAPPAALPASYTTSQMAATLDFWLYFFQFMVGTGVCLAFLNNLGQLVAALGGPHDGHVVFVSLFSVANAGGRLLGGYIPEQQLHSRGMPRTVGLAVVAALMACVAAMVSQATLGQLYAVSILLGLVFGAHWSLLPAITSDAFGLKHFAANYATLQFAPAAGSYVLATLLPGYLYDEAARAHGDPRRCIGSDCFGTAFQVLAMLAALSAALCVLAVVRSRPLYRTIFSHLHKVDVEHAHSVDP